VSAFADAHQGGITIVRHEASVYTAGWQASCTCGWVGTEVRHQPSRCLIDIDAHLTDVRPAKKERA
jgi:hypothetical protein